jgi:hypothetical protein
MNISPVVMGEGLIPSEGITGRFQSVTKSKNDTQIESVRFFFFNLCRSCMFVLWCACQSSTHLISRCPYIRPAKLI